MHSRFPRWAALTGAVAMSLAAFVPQGVAAQLAPPTDAGCSISSGFGPLTGQIFLDQGANIVGDCTQNPYADPTTWNILQPTTGGLLYLRSCDNATAFTDGTHTWLLGPSALQNRLNTDPLFDWECVPGPALSNLVQANPIPTATPVPPTPTAVPVVNTGPVNLEGADLSYQVRINVDYTNGDLYHTKLVGADFTSAKLSGANLKLSEVTRAIFSQADLTSVSMVNAFSNSGPQVPGPSFNQAKLSGARLTFAKIPYCDLRNADVHSADLDRATLTGCDMRWADLRGAVLDGANLSNANLSGANLTGATYVGAIWLNTIKTGCTGCP
jgi:uncharacterized protein YjbI with pentapeptide repeats